MSTDAPAANAGHERLLSAARRSVPDHGQIDAVRTRDMLVELIAHHAPRPDCLTYSGEQIWECSGCSGGQYAESRPEWHEECETTVILARHFGVTL